MSDACPSDGTVNIAFLDLAAKMANYDQQEVDAVLRESKLKQCQYGTLIRLQAAYMDTFEEEISWAIHEHIDIKAKQSSVWREYKDKKKSKHKNAGSGDDPLTILSQ